MEEVTKRRRVVSRWGPPVAEMIAAGLEETRLALETLNKCYGKDMERKRQLGKFSESHELKLAIEGEQEWWEESGQSSNCTVYDIYAGIAINAADKELSVCRELAQVALGFFNEQNPHAPYSTAEVEVVRAISDGDQNGATYSLTFTTNPNPSLVVGLMMKNPPPPISPTTFQSSVWRAYEPDGSDDLADRVIEIKIVDNWPLCFTR